MSKKLTIKTNSQKLNKYIEQIIKSYKLSDVDYIYNNEVFILFNTNQYKFTDIRNETYRKGFEYIEE